MKQNLSLWLTASMVMVAGHGCDLPELCDPAANDNAWIAGTPITFCKWYRSVVESIPPDSNITALFIPHPTSFYTRLSTFRSQPSFPI